MLARLFFSLVIGFVLSALGIILLPGLGRVAEPLLCAGRLEPELRLFHLGYRCVTAAGAHPVSANSVILSSLPILIGVLLPPLYLLLGVGARRAREAQGGVERDLAGAADASAEVLQVARRGSLKRQILLRAAELRLVLWVHPPGGRPYEATVAWLVEEEGLPRLRAGAVLPVRVNPQRPERVYPAEPWAHFAWWR